MARYEGQEISSGPSVVQNIPCGREGPEGAAFVHGKLLQQKGVKNRELWQTGIQR